jgi:hypothetical protein
MTCRLAVMSASLPVRIASRKLPQDEAGVVGAGTGLLDIADAEPDSDELNDVPKRKAMIMATR